MLIFFILFSYLFIFPFVLFNYFVILVIFSFVHSLIFNRLLIGFMLSYRLLPIIRILILMSCISLILFSLITLLISFILYCIACFGFDSFIVFLTIFLSFVTIVMLIFSPSLNDFLLLCFISYMENFIILIHSLIILLS